MKMFNFRLLALLAALFALPAMASAATDMYLKLTGVKGETKIVRCVNGACVVDGLAPGKYKVEVCDAKGAVIPSNLALEYSVKSPRDAASGQATGRRQHEPIRITQTPGATATNEIVITDAGSQVSIQIPTDTGAPKAQDHNSSRSNKSG